MELFVQRTASQRVDELHDLARVIEAEFSREAAVHVRRAADEMALAVDLLRRHQHSRSSAGNDGGEG